MRQVNLHEAKTHLSRLVAEAVAGESFVICKAGKALVQVSRLVETDDPVNPPGAALVCWRGIVRCPTISIRSPLRRSLICSRACRLHLGHGRTGQVGPRPEGAAGGSAPQLAPSHTHLS